MSDTVIAAAITAIPGTIAALGTIYAIMRLNKVATSVDGMKTELVSEVRKSATLEGKAEGQAVERDRSEATAALVADVATVAADKQQAAAEVQQAAADTQAAAAAVVAAKVEEKEQ